MKSLFGTHQTLYRGDEGLYFFAFSAELVQPHGDRFYSLRSELSIDHAYDFDQLLSKVDQNSYILSITTGNSTGR